MQSKWRCTSSSCSSPLQLNHQRYCVRCYFFHLSFRTPPVPLVFEDSPVYQPASQPRTSLLKFEGGGFSAPVIWSGQEQLVALLAALRHYPAGKTRKKKNKIEFARQAKFHRSRGRKPARHLIGKLAGTIVSAGTNPPNLRLKSGLRLSDRCDLDQD